MLPPVLREATSGNNRPPTAISTALRASNECVEHYLSLQTVMERTCQGSDCLLQHWGRPLAGSSNSEQTADEQGAAVAAPQR